MVGLLPWLCETLLQLYGQSHVRWDTLVSLLNPLPFSTTRGLGFQSRFSEMVLSAGTSSQQPKQLNNVESG